jgi:hypothetical protein
MYQGRRFQLPDPAGKSLYPAGKHLKLLEYGSRFPAENYSGFFRWILANIVCFPAENHPNNFPQNTASTKSLELLGTGRFRAGLFDQGNLVTRYFRKFFMTWEILFRLM